MGIYGLPPKGAGPIGPGEIRRALPQFESEIRPYKSPLVAARLLRIFAVASAAAAAASAAYLQGASGVLDRIRRDPLAVFQSDFVTLAANADRVLLFLLGAQLTTLVVMILWLRRLYRNLPALGARGTRFRPGWAVWGPIIPIFSLFRPKQMVDEVWRASDPELPESFYTPVTQVPRLLHVWWAAWVFVTVLGSWGFRRVPFDLAGVSRFLNVLFVAAVATAVAMVLLERVVAVVTVRHQSRAVKCGLEASVTPWAISTRVDGRFARTGLVAVLAPAGLALLGYGLGSIAGGASVEGDTGLRSGDGEVVLFTELSRGDCFDLPPGEVIVAVSRVPCSSSHDAEMLVSHSLGGNEAPYPGLDTVFDVVAERCVADFEEYVDQVYSLSELDVFFLYPNEEAWATGRRTVDCAIVTVDGSKLIDSVEGTGR